ncbi:MAG: V-type ATP synthase subunit I [Candidatus Marsarchaeota archaeon]|nr:V-type ATP synthase subunit I [Candidatus Marsarchaeota archaeon]
MFKPARMSRIRLILDRVYYEPALSALHDLGVMQVEQVPEDVFVLLGSHAIKYGEVGTYAQRFRSLEGMMHQKESKKRYLFESLSDLFSKADSIKIDERVSAISRDIETLSSKLKDLNDRLGTIRMIGHFDRDLSILNSSMTMSFLAYGQKLDEFLEIAEKNVDCIISKGKSSAIISISKQDQNKFGKFSEGYKIKLEVLPEFKGSLTEERSRLNAEIKKLEVRKSSLNDELDAISDEYYGIVSAIREQFDLETEKLDITSRLGISRSVITVDGWVPEANMKGLEKSLANVTKEHYILDTVETKSLPPTKFDNPVKTKLYEFFIRFYSLPRSDEIDPTVMFAFIFPIFFGLMVGDAGYGIVMLLGALWLIRRMKHPPKRSHIPKQISKFIGTIISPNGMVTIAKAIIPGSIIAIALGIVFNEYFGFQLPYVALFNVEVNLSKLLVISGWIGVAMVASGFILGFFNKMAIGQRKKAFGRLGWLSAAIGIVIFGLAVLHRSPLGFSNIPVAVSYVLIVGGIVSVLAFEGFESLMEIPSLVSHILSYTRLVGILLASVILAGVIDFVFIRGWAHGPLLGIVGTLILIIGQLFTFVIAIFEPGIQGARLIYVEFFSKFYTGNGNEFRPFSSRRRRTLSRFEMKEA